MHDHNSKEAFYLPLRSILTYVLLNIATYNLLHYGYVILIACWLSSSAALARCAKTKRDLPGYILREFLLISTISHVWRFFSPLFNRR